MNFKTFSTYSDFYTERLYLCERKKYASSNIKEILQNNSEFWNRLGGTYAPPIVVDEKIRMMLI